MKWNCQLRYEKICLRAELKSSPSRLSEGKGEAELKGQYDKVKSICRNTTNAITMFYEGSNQKQKKSLSICKRLLQLFQIQNRTKALCTISYYIDYILSTSYTVNATCLMQITISVKKQIYFISRSLSSIHLKGKHSLPYTSKTNFGLVSAGKSPK